MAEHGFEDLAVGDALRGGSRTVTDAEIALLPAFMGAINPLFHDEETARQGPLGGRVLYGPALLGIAIALTESLFGRYALGLVSLTDVRFRRPVRSGDTVSATVTVTGREPSRTRHAGRVTVEDEVTNQRGEAVLHFSRTLMLRSREENG